MSARRELQFAYETTTVDGERGRLLAAEQAAAVLEVLEWFQRRPAATRLTTKVGLDAASAARPDRCCRLPQPRSASIVCSRWANAGVPALASASVRSTGVIG